MNILLLSAIPPAAKRSRTIARPFSRASRSISAMLPRPRPPTERTSPTWSCSTCRRIPRRPLPGLPATLQLPPAQSCCPQTRASPSAPLKSGRAISCHNRPATSASSAQLRGGCRPRRSTPPADQRIAVRRFGRIELVAVDDLLYVEGADKYSELVLADGAAQLPRPVPRPDGGDAAALVRADPQILPGAFPDDLAPARPARQPLFRRAQKRPAPAGGPLALCPDKISAALGCRIARSKCGRDFMPQSNQVLR